jgi:hypothetical protein
MIIDCETWEEIGGVDQFINRPREKGIPVFVSWKRLKELLVGDQQAYTIECDRRGLLIRVNINSYDERGKHPMADRQV